MSYLLIATGLDSVKYVSHEPLTKSIAFSAVSATVVVDTPWNDMRLRCDLGLTSCCATNSGDADFVYMAALASGKSPLS